MIVVPDQAPFLLAAASLAALPEAVLPLAAPLSASLSARGSGGSRNARRSWLFLPALAHRVGRLHHRGSVTWTKVRGTVPRPSSVQKKSRSASCLLSINSRGEFAGASIKLVSHAIS